jgi:hypothetical protein
MDFVGLVTQWGGWAGIAALTVAVVQAVIVERWKRRQNEALQRLKHALDDDHERLKSALARVAFERQTQFASVYARRTEVLEGLYQRLVTAERLGSQLTPLMEFTDPDAPDNHEAEHERANQFAAAGNDVATYFNMNRLWLPDDLATMMESLVHAHYGAWVDFTMLDRKSPDYRQEWRGVWKVFWEQSPTARRQIERSMQRLLGILDEDAERSGG